MRFEPETFQLQAITLTTEPSSPDQLLNYHGYIAPDVLILFRIILCRVHSIKYVLFAILQVVQMNIGYPGLTSALCGFSIQIKN